MKKIYMLVLGFAGSISMSIAAHLGPQILFTTQLNGAQEVPSVTTNANGVASLYLNATRDTLCVRASWNGLSGAAGGIHIHEGAMGTNGGVLIDLSQDITGNQVYGRVSGTDLTPSLIAKLLSGNAYLNVHTSANPNGEIRGQIKAESDPGFYSYLTTGAETTPVMGSNATGFAIFKASRDKRSLWVEVISDSLSEIPGGAHLHYGAPGVAGGVILDLTSLINGKRISGTVSVTPGLLDSLMSGMVYINLHTSMNPAGEIRGQLENLPVLGFDAVLDTAQETTPVVLSEGRGIAHFHLMNTLDSFHFLVQVSGLTGPITGAHLHAGAVGTSGNVVLDLSGFVADNVISGVITGTDINPTFVNLLLSGELYLNIHTTLNPNGEIRGQVFRYLREGYTFDLDAAQETANVSSSARGIGFVSVDRDQTNAYYAVNVSGLTGAVGGAHIHTGARETDGGVTFDLSDDFAKTGNEDQAMGYIVLADAQQKADLRTNMMYLNIHTSMNMNGEIRGQIERKAACGNAAGNPSGLAPSIENMPKAYPNPGKGLFFVDLKTETSASYQVYDVSGKRVAEGVIEQGTAIDIQNLNNGIYFIRLNLGSETQTLKVQKQ